MFKSFKYELLKESLITLASNIENKKGYDIEIKNINALNSEEELNTIVVKVNKGDIEKLIKHITTLYNYRAQDQGNNIVTFTKI